MESKKKFNLTKHNKKTQDGAGGVISAWDKMMLAKYYPGRVDAPFVAAMGLPPLPTGTFHVGHDIV